MRHFKLLLFLSVSPIAVTVPVPANGAASDDDGPPFVASDPNSGSDLAMSGKYAQAITVLSRDIATKPTARAYFWRAECWRKADRSVDDDKAIADYSQSLALDPTLAAAYRNRGQCWTRKGDLARAIADFTQAMALAPDLPLVGERLADARLQSKDYAGAITDFSRLISRAQAGGSSTSEWDLPGYYYSRGTARAQVADLAGAAADFSDAIQAPCSAKIFLGGYSIRDLAHYQRGRTRAARKEIDGAIADFSEVIGRNPKVFEPYFSRGLAYRLKEDDRHAIADFSTCIALDGNDADSYDQRAHAYQHLGDYAKAESDFTRCVELEPKRADAFLHRGLVRIELNNRAGARADFDRAIVLHPTAEAYRARADLHQTEGETTAAASDLAKAAQLEAEAASRP